MRMKCFFMMKKFDCHKNISKKRVSHKQRDKVRFFLVVSKVISLINNVLKKRNIRIFVNESIRKWGHEWLSS